MTRTRRLRRCRCNPPCVGYCKSADELVAEEQQWDADDDLRRRRIIDEPEPEVNRG